MSEPRSPMSPASPLDAKPDEKVLTDIFKLIDEDGGGSISFDEVKHFCSALPTPPADKQIREMVNECSAGSGEVSMKNFIHIAMDLPNITGVSALDHSEMFKEMQYKNLFQQLDPAQDDEGEDFVTKTDLLKLFVGMELNMSDEDIRKIFLKYDEDGSGSIQLEEFIGIVTDIQKQKGMNLSQVVSKFSQAQEAKKAKMAQMRQAFGVDKAAKAFALAGAKAKEKKEGAGDLERLREENEELKRQIEMLESELRNVKDEIDEMNAEKQGLLKKHSTMMDIEAEMERMKGDKDEQIKSLTASVKDLEERLKSKGGESAAKDAQKMRKAQEEVESGKRKIKILEGKLEHMTKRIKTIEAQAHQKAAMKLAQAEQGIEQRNQKIKELSTMLQASQHASRRMSQQDGMMAEFQSMLAEKDHTIAQLQQSVYDAQGAVGSETQVWALEEALKIRCNEISRLQASLKDFAEQVSQLDRKLADAMLGVVSQSETMMAEADKSMPEMSKEDGEQLRIAQAEILRLQEQVAAGAGSGEADALLQQEVWALEAALEIRTRENERLDHMMKEFIQQVSGLDAALAEQMAQALKESTAQRESDERDALDGKTADEALADIKKKKKTKGKKKGKKDDDEGDLGNVAEKEIDRLKKLLGRKEGQLQQYQQQARQRVLDYGGAQALGWVTGPGGQMRPPPGWVAPQPGQPGWEQYQQMMGAGAFAGQQQQVQQQQPEFQQGEALIVGGGRQLVTLEDYKAEVLELHKQLEAAQKAIIAGTHYGWQRDVKLGVARRALSMMLDTGEEGAGRGNQASFSPPSGRRPDSVPPAHASPSVSVARALPPPPAALLPPPGPPGGAPAVWQTWRAHAVAAGYQSPPAPSDRPLSSSAHVWQSPPRPAPASRLPNPPPPPRPPF